MSNGRREDARKAHSAGHANIGKFKAPLVCRQTIMENPLNRGINGAKTMLKILGALAVAAAIVLGLWFYITKRKAMASEMASERAVSAEGVKKDLLAFAHAERAYKASHGTYASVDDLYAGGELKKQRPPRDGYTYSWGNSAIGFSVIARCQIKTSAPCPSFSIDQSTQLQQLP